MRLYYFFLCVIVGLSFGLSLVGSQDDASWAQKTLREMSLDEKIGQLFMVAAYVDRDYANREIGNPQILEEIDDYITRYYVGGLAYVGPSECAKQVALTNHYQAISKYPILIAQDLEWGLAMRVRDGMCFPKNITLGAVDNRLIYEMGKEIGNQARLIGVHMNLSPVLDVNIEPENLSINVRSFGSTPEQVAAKGIAMIQGLQEAGIVASAKHFPGLGDISIDPHLGLPFCPHDRKRLLEVELSPFAQAIKAGVLSIQTEHLVVPSLDSNPNLPSSLSPEIVNDLLKREMGFTGLVLSGALRMKALTMQFTDEEIILKAFLAGSDMLLMPQDVPKAVATLKAALAEGKISEKDVGERVLKILQMKENVQLDRQRIVPIPTTEQLNSPAALALKKQLFQSAVRVLRNDHHLIPLSLNAKDSIAYVQLGDAPSATFFETLSQVFAGKHMLNSFVFPLVDDDVAEQQKLFEKLDEYSVIILAVYPANPRRIEQIRLLNEKKQAEALKQFRVHGISEELLRLANRLTPHHQKTVVAYFGNPFGLPLFNEFSTLIMAYETDIDAQQAAVELNFISFRDGE